MIKQCHSLERALPCTLHSFKLDALIHCRKWHSLMERDACAQCVFQGSRGPYPEVQECVQNHTHTHIYTQTLTQACTPGTVHPGGLWFSRLE